ncbi:aminopeptidase [Neosynechococcus sphagnicola sy1]|uniref:Aminopeptidase n=1 Tax=Neosynechococcus sphagnicola sy1 TaxID=1497020 RepID=A0A098TM66_9CYAN|nr:aminopeptidase P family protein [Neosynechococcus sphagnicola]KGF72957.1 aminopeptidase [Neosynechococcus sphagnicola sy1]
MTSILTPPVHLESVQFKLSGLRTLMAAHGLEGYLIPSADEHLNEYVPTSKQRRSWLSGFTGSAGDCLISSDQAWLFVDARYYQQADLEVDPTLIQVCKLELSGHKTLLETLESLGYESMEKGKSFGMGFDPFTVSVEQVRAWERQLEPTGVELIPIPGNLVDQVRADQGADVPPDDTSPVFALPAAIAGEAFATKLQRVRDALKQAKVGLLPITKLDQIAWVFNLRGWDVPYNPVLIAYAVITLDAVFLFTNLQRLDQQVRQTLQPLVTLLPYEAYPATLQKLTAQLQPPRVLVDLKQTTLGTYQLLTPKAGADQVMLKIVEAVNPIEGMKACKNTTEIAQMQQANLKASRAKVRTLKWIADQQITGQSMTEADVAVAIAQFYRQETEFQGLSFPPISAVGANSSIVHYGTPDPEVVLQPGCWLLLDSGAQYLMGTTDDTRTLVIGDPTPRQIACYTEVLKAHINCAMQRFPKGTTGIQLDGITRADLWQAGLDYGHGTGHGVGAFLNVHEGPNGISKRAQEPLVPGMINSIEPGYYEPGWGGIRLENLYVVRELTVEAVGHSTPVPWYGFEPLTFIPFEPRLIDLEQLESRQRQWLGDYHAAVVAQLTPTLTADEAAWLQAACRL